MSIIRNSIKDNFTQIPNHILDADISSGAFRVLVYLYSKPNNWYVRNKDIMNRLNIGKQDTVAKYWKELLEANLIDRTKDKGNSYNYTLLEGVPPKKVDTIHPIMVDTVPPKMGEHSNTKNNTNNKQVLENLPDTINKDAFNEWLDYKKYKTKTPITKCINMMSKYSYVAQQQMVDTSIMNGWKGLFEPKQKQTTKEKTGGIQCY